MGTFLFILKILGVAITGRATLVGLFKREIFETVEIPPLIVTTPPTPPKIGRRLTKHGQQAIFWAVFGILVSLVAQGVEQSLNIKRAREASRKTQEQMSLLNESVDALRRLVGQVQTIDAAVVIELDATNQVFADVHAFLASQTAHLTNRGSLRPAEQLGILKNLTSGLPGLNIDLTSKDWLTNRFAWADVLLRELTSPSHQVRFYVGDSPSPSSKTNPPPTTNPPSLKLRDSARRVAIISAAREVLCASSPRVRQASLHFEPGGGRLTLVLEARFPSDSWTRLQPTVSRVDLSRGTVLLVVPEPTVKLFSRTAPIRAQLVIDGTRFPLPDAQLLQFEGFGASFEWTNFRSVQDEHAVVGIPASAIIYCAALPELDK